ncbi:MAG: hypothetical protein AB7U20_22025, partial [Planctomycetaceae bacterium]
DKNGRVNASGTVEFEGKPLTSGTVRFLHHTTGHVAMCEIKDGQYASESGEGPNPGENTVMIMGKEADGETAMWQHPWKKDVTVGDSDFTENFSFGSSDVKPFDPSTITKDEDL